MLNLIARWGGKALLPLLFLLLTSKVQAQSETFPSGSFIINMGIEPQTVNNALRPYGLIWDIIKNNKAQVKWVINPAKGKDGIDFTHNAVNYKGVLSSFRNGLLPLLYRPK